MRPAGEAQWRPDPSFTRISLGRRILIAAPAIVRYAPELLVKLRELSSRPVSGEGNRASATRIALPGGPELIARRSRRGGMVSLVLAETFFGFRLRPFRELAASAEARRRGVAVAEPLGALVEWLAPAVYRGWFLTRALNGMTLWDFIRHDDDPVVRGHVLLRARESVATMHNCGVFHADLNLRNLFVTQKGESFEVVILDLDKARIFDDPLPAKMRRANAARLLRSARKLDPEGRYLDAAALKVLDVG
ncbi:MAG TPA: lipopolysaccharide kinase InaA family protein [Candidatus Binataceae bacterium]|nr:lipopolysaccharide kinase InaA family protein [Candidatus Binataceae bacterium]